MEGTVSKNVQKRDTKNAGDFQSDIKFFIDDDSFGETGSNKPHFMSCGYDTGLVSYPSNASLQITLHRLKLSGVPISVPFISS